MKVTNSKFILSLPRRKKKERKNFVNSKLTFPVLFHHIVENLAILDVSICPILLQNSSKKTENDEKNIFYKAHTM